MNQADKPSQNRSSRVTDHHLRLLIFIVFTLIWSLFIHSRAYSANDASRMATIDSLVHRQTWVIDDSALQSIDRIQVDGHFVSDKPPMLPFIGAGVYAVLYHGGGLTLQADGCDADAPPAHCRALWERDTADWAYFILTLLLIGMPATLILILMFNLARQNGWSQRNALLFVLIFGLGTAVFPYSVVFTNHVPAAAAVFVAFYLLLTNDELSSKQLAVAGFASALAVTIDLSAGIFLVAFAGYVLWHYRQKAFWFALGSATPFIVLAILDYQITGNILPAQFYSEGYEYQGSSLPGKVGGNQRADNVALYAYEMLLGSQGVFAFYPLLVWYLYALIYACRHEVARRRQLALLVAVSTVMYVAYFVLSTDNFGGTAYSPRWLLLPVPLLATFAIINLDIYRPKWRVSVFAGLALISIVSTYRGALNPWETAQPIFHLAYDSPPPNQIIPVVLSGYEDVDDVNEDMPKILEEDNLQYRWFDARSGFVVPTGTDGWWFISEATPMAPELSALLGMKMDPPYMLQGDLTNLAEAVTANLSKDVFQSELTVPQQDSDLHSLSLPLSFSGADGVLALQGYQWQQQNEEGVLITAWQVDTRSETMPQDRRVFIHLLAENGDIVQQNDLFAANYGSLLSGDQFFQVQKLPLFSLSPGDYWLQLGVYQPDSGLRILTEGGDERLLLGKITIPLAEDGDS